MAGYVISIWRIVDLVEVTTMPQVDQYMLDGEKRNQGNEQIEFLWFVQKN